MTKLLLHSFCLLFLLFSACTQVKELSVPYNVETQIEEETLLLGQIDREGFALPAYQAWFDSTYQAYTVDQQKLSELKAGLEGVVVKAFVATWCSDTRREIPAFYKILDELEFDEKSLSMVAVDRNREAPNDLQAGYDIAYVPTLIFLRDDQELGRIVEAPQQSLEEDLWSILNQ